MPTIKQKGAAAFIALATSIGAPATMYSEGVRLTPYYDAGGVKTWCVGETQRGYKEKFTYEECGALFKIQYGFYSYKTMLFYNDTAQAIVTEYMHAAFTDMSYNIGLYAVSKSTMIKEANAGRAVPACNAIKLYYKAAGKDCRVDASCKGVWSRRLRTVKMCLTGQVQ